MNKNTRKNLKKELRDVFNIDLNKCRYMNCLVKIKVRYNNFLYIYNKKTNHIELVINLNK
jgi:ribosomal protein L23